MCSTCERIRAEAPPRREPLSATKRAMLDAALAIKVLDLWFDGHPRGPRLFRDIPVDELRVAREHAEKARDLLDKVIAGRSA